MHRNGLQKSACETQFCRPLVQFPKQDVEIDVAERLCPRYRKQWIDVRWIPGFCDHRTHYIRGQSHNHTGGQPLLPDVKGRNLTP